MPVDVLGHRDGGAEGQQAAVLGVPAVPFAWILLADAEAGRVGFDVRQRCVMAFWWCMPMLAFEEQCLLRRNNWPE